MKDSLPTNPLTRSPRLTDQVADPLVQRWLQNLLERGEEELVEAPASNTTEKAINARISPN